MLTKKQIEAIEIGGRDDEWEMSGDLSMDDARELRRLALLGIERDLRAERIGRAVLVAFEWLAWTLRIRY
jgi:archaellum component FlaD/FlaE